MLPRLAFRRVLGAAVVAGLVVAGAVPVAAAGPAAPVARVVHEDNGVYSFDYSYPAAVAAVPALKARLDADLARRRTMVVSEATEAKADAAKGGYPYNPYGWSQKWSVVTAIPGWLSLSADYWSYTGGAHGMMWWGAMLWDRKANLPRNPLDLFVSKAALSKAIRAPFCAALDRQRAKKRGEPVNRSSGDQFDACIDPVAETVILGSAGRQKFDRIGILIAPYNAGPYAEGTYEVTLPVTPAVLAAVKPAFKGAFSVQK